MRLELAPLGGIQRHRLACGGHVEHVAGEADGVPFNALDAFADHGVSLEDQRFRAFRGADVNQRAAQHGAAARGLNDGMAIARHARKQDFGHGAELFAVRDDTEHMEAGRQRLRAVGNSGAARDGRADDQGDSGEAGPGGKQDLVAQLFGIADVWPERCRHVEIEETEGLPLGRAERRLRSWQGIGAVGLLGQPEPPFAAVGRQRRRQQACDDRLPGAEAAQRLGELGQDLFGQASCSTWLKVPREGDAASCFSSAPLLLIQISW